MAEVGILRGCEVRYEEEYRVLVIPTIWPLNLKCHGHIGIACNIGMYKIDTFTQKTPLAFSLPKSIADLLRSLLCHLVNAWRRKISLKLLRPISNFFSPKLRLPHTLKN